MTDTVVYMTDAQGTHAVRSGDSDFKLVALVDVVVEYMTARGLAKLAVAREEPDIEDILKTDALLYGTACYTFNPLTGKKTRVDPTKVQILP